MEYQKVDELCFTRRRYGWLSISNTFPAAMVFVEAADATPKLAHLEPRAIFVKKMHQSALTPKAPAPPKFSHSDAQAHRLSNRPMQFIEDKMHIAYFAIGKLHRARPRLSHV